MGYGNPEIPAPYNLDEIDLDYLEQTLKHQMYYGEHPLASLTTNSLGSEDYASYKAKIASLLGGENTKGSTSSKENYEDLNDEDSPIFNNHMGAFYNDGQRKYMVTNDGELIELASDYRTDTDSQPLASTKSDNQNVDAKLQRKREKRKEKKQRRKLKRQAEKQKYMNAVDSILTNQYVRIFRPFYI